MQSLEKIINLQTAEIQNQLIPILPAISNIFKSESFTLLQEDIKMSLSSMAKIPKEFKKLEDNLLQPKNDDLLRIITPLIDPLLPAIMHIN
jgi:hypothetical protein